MTHLTVKNDVKTIKKLDYKLRICYSFRELDLSISVLRVLFRMPFIHDEFLVYQEYFRDKNTLDLKLEFRVSIAAISRGEKFLMVVC